MKKNEVFQIIFESLAERMKEHGFLLQKTKRRFLRKTSFGKQVVSFPLAKHGSRYRLGGTFITGFDDLEDIMNQGRTHPSVGHDTTVTTAFRIGRFKDNHNFWYEVNSKEQLLEVLEDFWEITLTQGIPQFETINTLEKLEHEINKDPMSRSPYISMGMREKYGLTLSKMLQREGYHELVNAYRASYDKIGTIQSIRDRFEAWVTQLETMDLGKA